MVFLVGVAVAVFVVLASAWYYVKVTRIKQKLNWVVKVPGVPLLGNALDFKSSTQLLDAFSQHIQNHGKLIYMQIFTQNILVATDYKFLEFVMSSNKIIEKSDNYRFLHSWLETGLLTSGGAKWKARRRIITPSFHFKILEQFVPVFEAQSEILIKKLENEVGKDSVDIYPYITLCALDIICETAMGTSINAQSHQNMEYVDAVKEMCRLIMVRAFSPIKMFDFFYRFSSDYANEKKAVNILHSHTKSVIAKRKQLRNSTKTDDEHAEDDIGIKKKVAFLDMLLDATIDGNPLSDDDIREEVDTFMFEGHDTTTSAISFALYLLANHPDVQRKVVEEQVALLGKNKNRVIEYRDLQEMKYLELVIKEALRMYPSVPFYARKIIEDIEYQGNIIPKDISIILYAYGVNNDPDNFPEPEKFDPTRYESVDGTSPYSYLPFSAGPRNCIGQKFAVLEMKSMISSILRHYELSPAVPKHEIVLAAETVLKSANGIRIKLEKRERGA